MVQKLINITALKMKEHLEQNGLRITTPRLCLINAISLHRTPFTIEDLSDKLPDVGRATVFRNIKLLVEFDVVCRLTTHGGQVNYMLSENWIGRHHHHAICIDCNKVNDFSSQFIEKELLKLFGDATNVVDHELSIYIRCSDCTGKVTSKKR